MRLPIDLDPILVDIDGCVEVSIIDFHTFFEHQDRHDGNSFRKAEFLMAPLAKPISGK